MSDGRLYPFPMTRAELGLCIDGVAMLVTPTDQEAAPLLKRLQNVYAASKELEPRG